MTEIREQTIDSKEELIKFFEAIPRDKWCQGSIKKSGKHCAVGHFISFYWNKETHDFIETIGVRQIVAANDAPGNPKDNVLDFLRSL